MSLAAIEQTIKNKSAALRAAEDASRWRFYQGSLDNGQAVGLDDSAWPEVRLSHTWVGAAGDAWFRKTFSFPEQVEGIPTAGARIELPILVPIHSNVFVNGVERVAEPSWLDTRAVPLVISEQYQPGEDIQVTMHAYHGDGFGLAIATRVEVSTVEEMIFRLDVLLNQLRLTYHLAYEGDSASPERQALWEKAVAQLDTAALAANAWDAWWASADQARQALSPFEAEAKTFTTHLIAHSHIDMNWLWTWEETVDVIRRDFVAMDGLMERYPDFRFSQSQASTYKAMEDYQPEVLERAKERVAQGKWDVTASTWVEGDLNMESGESLVRHLLLTRPYIQSRLGVRPRICWEPDTFGHCGTLPQLLQQAGIDYYYHCRAGKGQPLFWWEGMDGSRVLAFNDPFGYGGVVEPDGVSLITLDLSRRYQLKRGMFLYGAGDHGGSGTARDIERARQLDATPLLPHAKMSDVISFYDAAREEASNLQVIRGELNTTFEGCYTTHGDIKKFNRQGENKLLTAESLATLARTLTGTEYPAEDLTESWRTLLFHHFHDILCGCSIGATYKEAAGRLQPMLDDVTALTADSLAQLAENVDTGAGTDNDLRFVVWNQLAWTRTDVARFSVEALKEVPTALVDDAGKVVPVQVAGDELLFIASDVPALGCRVYRPTNQKVDTDLTAEDNAALQNSLLSFHVHSASGAIDSMADLELGRTIDTLGSWKGVERKESAGYINRLQVLWETPHTMSAWNIGDITHTDNLITGAQVRVTERGPVRATVEVSRKFLNSSLTQRYHLYAGLRRIDIENELDWHESGGKDKDAPMLRATFKPQLGPGKATFEVPFAGLERVADGDEVPALRWSDVSDGEYGLSLLNNAKYGHQAHGVTLGMTLVRAPYEPDNLPDQGLQTFTYSLYPHAGNWRQASTDRRAAELNQPLLVAVDGSHPGSIPANQAMLTCEPAGVMVTAVKVAESDPNAIVVRLVEMHGQPTQANLRWAWPVERVEEVNILEEHLRDLDAETHGCQVEIGQHKVVTLRLTLSPA